MPLLSDFQPKREVTRAYDAYIEERGRGNRSLVLIEDAEVKCRMRRPPPWRSPART
jgi:alkyl hydroperoxide reductase subunit AhpC